MAEFQPADELRVLPRHVPKARPGRVMPLREAAAGMDAHILAIRLNADARENLYRQGLVESRRIRILHNDHRGRIMLRMGGDIFLLGRRETPRIQVREIVVE